MAHGRDYWDALFPSTPSKDERQFWRRAQRRRAALDHINRRSLVAAE